MMALLAPLAWPALVLPALVLPALALPALACLDHDGPIMDLMPPSVY